MAELSRFYGIIIRMFAEHGVRHHTPHFHAIYQDDEAVFTINPVEILSGSMPTKQQRLVVAWAEIHHDELLTAWELLDGGKKPPVIEPLK